jgi:hypothetical protein
MIIRIHHRKKKTPIENPNLFLENQVIEKHLILTLLIIMKEISLTPKIKDPKVFTIKKQVLFRKEKNKFLI